MQKKTAESELGTIMYQVFFVAPLEKKTTFRTRQLFWIVVFINVIAQGDVRSLFM